MKTTHLALNRVQRVAALVMLGLVFASYAHAQGNNGRGKCMQPFGISFYLVKPGYEDEWLDLYMEWHYPLLEYALEQGTLVEHKLFVPDGHGLEGAYTFAASFLAPAAQESATAPLDRASPCAKRGRPSPIAGSVMPSDPTPDALVGTGKTTSGFT